MQQKILELIAQNPRGYVKAIKRDPTIAQWVQAHSTATAAGHWPSMIYSAVHGVSDVCGQGQQRKFDRWSTGFVGCGPASVCDCTRQAISQQVQVTKQLQSPQQKHKTNLKRAETMLAKYGVAHNLQRAEVQAKLRAPKIHASARSLIKPVVNTNNHVLVELEIQQFLESLGLEVEQHNRTVLGKKEIDLYVPLKKFGVEVNGLYWHSLGQDQQHLKNQHLEKTELAQPQGVELFHVTDWEWANKKPIVTSMLRSRMGMTNRIWARKCCVVELSASQAREFFDKNHIQGFCKARYYMGLTHNGQLVMAISLSKNRFQRHQKDWELVRMCSKLDTTVVGGASRLIQAAHKMLDYQPITSYCDRSKSSGRGYLAAGFQHVRNTGPGYFWTDGNGIWSRYQCSKNQMSKWLPTYSPQKTQDSNMFDAKYRKFWDCGNSVWRFGNNPTANQGIGC
jgi:hypothetical protein